MDTAQIAQAGPGLLERIRDTGTLGIPAIKKLLEEAVMPIEGTAIDLLPLVIMFLLLGAGSFLALRLKNRQAARRALQTFSALAFVVGVHPCMCMLRDVVLGAVSISTNTLEAFKYLMVFAVVSSFTLICGRIFCGWICPLGFFQELSSAYFQWARKNKAGGILALGLLSVAAAGLVRGGVLGLVAVAPFAGPALVILLVYLLVPQRESSLVWARWGLVVVLLAYLASYFFILRPGTFAFIETVAVWWVMALLVLALFVIVDRTLDERFKPLKTVSAALFVLIMVAGVYTSGPFCIFFQSEVDLSTVLSATGIIALSGILSNAWCRYLCPEGAVLGLLAKRTRWGIAKLEQKCNSCRACEPVCPVDAIKVGDRDETTCIFCARCVDACPKEALVFGDEALRDRVGQSPGFVPVEKLVRKPS